MPSPSSGGGFTVEPPSLLECCQRTTARKTPAISIRKCSCHKLANPCPIALLVAEKQHEIPRARLCTQSCSKVSQLLVNSSPTPHPMGSCRGLRCSCPLAAPDLPKHSVSSFFRNSALEATCFPFLIGIMLRSEFLLVLSAYHRRKSPLKSAKGVARDKLQQRNVIMPHLWRCPMEPLYEIHPDILGSGIGNSPLSQNHYINRNIWGNSFLAHYIILM